MSVAQNRPNALVDSASSGGPSRAGKYSEAYTQGISHKELFSADEGSYFVAISATPGTGVIGHAAPTTFDETKPYLLVYNGTTDKRIALQYLRFHETVVSTGATRTQWTFTIDEGNRLSSAGTAATINNVNMASANTSGAAIKHGAPVATAASSSRRVLGHYSLRGSIDVVEDNLEFVFGGLGGQNVLAPATVMAVTVNIPPVIIGPGQSFMAYQWSTSQSAAPTLEMVLGFIER